MGDFLRDKTMAKKVLGATPACGRGQAFRFNLLARKLAKSIYATILGAGTRILRHY